MTHPLPTHIQGFVLTETVPEEHCTMVVEDGNWRFVEGAEWGVPATRVPPIPHNPPLTKNLHVVRINGLDDDNKRKVLALVELHRDGLYETVQGERTEKLRGFGECTVSL